MMQLPELTQKQQDVLMIIGEDRHAILFDLEVQELEKMGLLEGKRGYHLITELGYEVLAALHSDTSRDRDEG